MQKKDRMRLCMNVLFNGVDGFEKYRPNVEIILCSVDKSSLINFRLAINEAICNALRYGSGGIEQAQVRLSIRYSGNFILAKISSENNGFNVREHVEKLSEADQQDWWDYLKSKNRGRGLWIMLSGSQKVIYNASGNQVILATKINHQEPEKKLLSKVHVLAK